MNVPSHNGSRRISAETAPRTPATPMSLTIYFVGPTKEAAMAGLPFDSYESASSYLLDQGSDTSQNIYSATATVDTSTLTRED